MTRSRRGAQGGFTLMEITIVIAILAFGLLSLALMQMQAIKGGGRGRHATQGQAIAQTQMELFQRLNWTLLVPIGWTSLPDVSNTVQGDGNTSAELAYAVSFQVADVDVGWTRSVDIRVSWTEPGGQSRNVTLSSIRYNWEEL